MLRQEIFRLIASRLSLYALDSQGLCTVVGEFEAQSLATIIASQNEARLCPLLQYHDKANEARYSILRPSKDFAEIFGAPAGHEFYLLERDRLGTTGIWIAHHLFLHYKELWAEPPALTDDDFLD